MLKYSIQSYKHMPTEINDICPIIVTCDKGLDVWLIF